MHPTFHSWKMRGRAFDLWMDLFNTHKSLGWKYWGKRERERDILSCRVKTSVRCKSSRQLLSSFILKWREIKDSWVLRTKPWKSERFLTLIRRNAPRKKMCVHRRKKNLFNRDWFLPRPPSLLPSWRWWIRSRCHPAKLTGRSDKKGNLLFHH